VEQRREVAVRPGGDRARGRSGALGDARRPHLTDRQRQVATLFCSGLTYREVAAECGLSPETINPTLKAAARNLGAGNRIARAVLKPLLEGAA